MSKKPPKDQHKKSKVLHTPKIVFRPNTAHEEFQQIVRTIKRKKFYEQKGYTYKLPEIAMLREPISPKLETKALEIFIQSEYDEGFYKAGMSALENKRDVVENAVKVFSKWNNKWEFFILDSYNIRLTRYGSGGSYNASTGDIVILTTREGCFKRGSNPAHTIIHEAVHIGLEKNFIKKYGLTHEQKERLVDLVVVQHFDTFIPEYKLQNIGDTTIDKFLNLKDMVSLDKQLKSFANSQK